MRWPGAWKTPSALSLLKGTAVNCLLVERSADLQAVVTQAKQAGLAVAEAASPPAGVRIVQGEWPGVQMSRSGGADRASAGPTGAPWVDSNGWKVRLEAALHPGAAVWVDAVPKAPRVVAGAYQLAVADAAAHGGRWILSLDDQLATGIADQKPEALDTWKNVAGAAGFFASHKTWSDYLPEAVIGVISSFAGDNEFMGQELLNLLARANQQYRIIVKTKTSESSWSGLRAVLYADAEPPAPDLRKQILAFVEAGGLLIAGPKWGTPPGTPAREEAHPRYSELAIGKGRVALARSDPDDPYILANDSVLLVSHRHDLLRFWNGGAVGSCLTAAPDRKRALAHLLFYANRGPDAASVRVAGRYRAASLWTLDRPAPRRLEIELQKDAVELHLPQVSQYAAAELEA